MPVSSASAVWRMRCTSAREAAEVIQRRADFLPLCVKAIPAGPVWLIERERGFQRDERQRFVVDPFGEGFLIELLGIVRSSLRQGSPAASTCNASGAQFPKAASRNRGIGVGHRGDDAGDAGGDDGACAGRSAAGVAARLEINVERRAARGAGGRRLRGFQSDATSA